MTTIEVDWDEVVDLHATPITALKSQAVQMVPSEIIKRTTLANAVRMVGEELSPLQRATAFIATHRQVYRKEDIDGLYARSDRPA
jgi:hypothetical protein